MRAVFEIDLHEDTEKEFLDDYIQTIIKMFLMFGFVDSVTKAEIETEKKEFFVDYKDCYTKSVYATNEAEARRLVIDEKQGDTLYFHQEVNEIEVKR